MRRVTSHRSNRMRSDNEGKGTLGCIITLLLLAIATVATIRIGPPYFAFKSFEADLKKEASKAGANAYDDETIIKNVVDLARRNEIRLQKEDVTVERYAGQVHVTVRYSLPLDLFFYQHNINMDVRVSSLVGRL
jgi:hypothetical protein